MILIANKTSCHPILLWSWYVLPTINFNRSSFVQKGAEHKLQNFLSTLLTSLFREGTGTTHDAVRTTLTKWSVRLPLWGHLISQVNHWYDYWPKVDHHCFGMNLSNINRNAAVCSCCCWNIIARIFCIRICCSFIDFKISFCDETVEIVCWPPGLACFWLADIFKLRNELN